MIETRPLFGICPLSIVPVRSEPSDRSEQVTQLLFGDSFEVLETQKKWTKIRIQDDQYEGWIDAKQWRAIDEKHFDILKNEGSKFCGDLLEFISGNDNFLMSIPLGSQLNFLNFAEINRDQWIFEGLQLSGMNSKSEIIRTAFLYLNAPYLWGGKTPFGIDCSGFTQMVYKLNGYHLKRDASQQALQGEALSFIEESEPGDLAFFDNEEGKIIHVGIIMQDHYIIHASGKVRIDRLDHLGIFNIDNQQHTHKLRVIKKII
jgi:gamma-D-glutamyl-L-lysine dipeptidyl-peptidase